MNVMMWAVLGLFIVILPAVAVTNGGRSRNEKALRKYAADAGLPLTPQVEAPVLERITRREKGMLRGAVAGLVATMVIGFVIDRDGTWGPLVYLAAIAFLGLGGAIAVSRAHPPAQANGVTVARARQVELSDYLTQRERIGRTLAPVTVLLTAAVGLGLMLMIPGHPPIKGLIITGAVGSALALLLWAATLVVSRRVLEAPARSGSDLELAWDDVERASALRLLNDATVFAAGMSTAGWTLAVLNLVMSNHLWISHPWTRWIAIASVVATVVCVAISALPVLLDWQGGKRRGHVLDELWPNRPRTAADGEGVDVAGVVR